MYVWKWMSKYVFAIKCLINSSFAFNIMKIVRANGWPSNVFTPQNLSLCKKFGQFCSAHGHPLCEDVATCKQEATSMNETESRELLQWTSLYLFQKKKSSFNLFLLKHCSFCCYYYCYSTLVSVCLLLRHDECEDPFSCSLCVIRAAAGAAALVPPGVFQEQVLQLQGRCVVVRHCAVGDADVWWVDSLKSEHPQ